MDRCRNDILKILGGLCNPVSVSSVLKLEAAWVGSNYGTNNYSKWRAYLVQRKQATARTVSYHDSSRRILNSKIVRVHKLTPQSRPEAQSLIATTGVD